MQPKNEPEALRSKVTNPAHSTVRAKNSMLAPSAAAPRTPGAPGIAGEFPSEPVTHRRTPAEQNPTPSQHWFPPVTD